MWRPCSVLLRYRTAWRELLHPLPVPARHDQWLKRDTVEMNEALLRRPYYTIKSFHQSAYVQREELFQEGSAGSSSRTSAAATSPQDPNYTMAQALRHRRVRSEAQRRALRDQLRFPGQVGPPTPTEAATGQTSYVEEYGARLRPRYPQSWDTVPPHQPSRSNVS